MGRNRKPEDCLIVAADFKPEKGEGRKEVRGKVMDLAKKLEGLNVYIKVNSILRACGYDLIDELRAMGLRVFADLKLKDISETMWTDALLLKEARPEIITVMCDSGIDGMRRFQEVFKDTETQVLGVTILTTFDEEECQSIYACSTKAGVVRFARFAELAGLNGLILSTKELEVVVKRKELNQLSKNTPGIRPGWAEVKNDDQKRVGGIEQAFKDGANAIVMGRPIVEYPDPREATEKSLAEIAEALNALSK